MRAQFVQVRDSFIAKGGKVLGDIMEVPGHVKLLMIVDKDHNHLQLCEILSPSK